MTVVKKKPSVVFILTGFGLGDVFNFGLHILPAVLCEYGNVHIITEHTENIFRYMRGVFWHASNHAQVGATLDSVLDKHRGKIDTIMYLDNHIEPLMVIKKIASSRNIHLSYPSRKLINQLVSTEKGFYFNIYIRMVQALGLSVPQPKKESIKLYGEKEVATYREYCAQHQVDQNKLNVLFIPGSGKKIKSISPSALNGLVEWFNHFAPRFNIFIVSKNLEYLLPGVYHLNRYTVLEVCYFIEKSDICVSVDTGFIHVANSLKKNIIGLFGPTSVKGSLYTHDNVLEITNIVQKERCRFYEKNVYRNACMRNDKCIHNE